MIGLLFFVIRALDARIYPSGCPHVVRAPRRVDARVKPAHDEAKGNA
jgi:hypothetical protein